MPGAYGLQFPPAGEGLPPFGAGPGAEAGCSPGVSRGDPCGNSNQKHTGVCKKQKEQHTRSQVREEGWGAQQQACYVGSCRSCEEVWVSTCAEKLLEGFN